MDTKITVKVTYDKSVYNFENLYITGLRYTAIIGYGHMVYLN